MEPEGLEARETSSNPARQNQLQRLPRRSTQADRPPAAREGHPALLRTRTSDPALLRPFQLPGRALRDQN